MKYKYAVVIPHYQDEIRLEKLIKSIPSHHYSVQIIIVDDCSPDQFKLEQLSKKYPEIHWLSTGNNAGAGAARNVGLDVAQSEYILFADSDDEFCDNAFSILEDATKSNGELYYFLAESASEDSNNQLDRAKRYNKLCIEHLKYKDKNSLANLKLNHVVPWAKAYKLSSIQNLEIRFDEVRLSNDVAFNVLSAFQLNDIEVIPKSLYRVYSRSGSLTTDKGSEAFLARLKVYANLSSRLKAKGIPYRPSVAGALPAALKFGPDIFIKVIKLALFSDLKLNLHKVFNIRLWIDFFSKSKRQK